MEGASLWSIIGIIGVGGATVFWRLVREILVEDDDRWMVLFGFGMGWTLFCAGLYLLLQERACCEQGNDPGYER